MKFPTSSQNRGVRYNPRHRRRRRRLVVWFGRRDRFVNNPAHVQRILATQILWYETMMERRRGDEDKLFIKASPSLSLFSLFLSRIYAASEKIAACKHAC